VFELSATLRQEATAAYIGDSTYSEFHNWVKNADLPNPEDVLNGSVKFEHKPARLDRTAAVIGACQSVTLQSPDHKAQYAAKMWEFLSSMPDGAADLCLGAVEALVRGQCVANNKAAFAALSRFKPLVEAAGIRRS
jgi:hypothetical protein